MAISYVELKNSFHDFATGAISRSSYFKILSKFSQQFGFQAAVLETDDYFRQAEAIIQTGVFPHLSRVAVAYRDALNDLHAAYSNSDLNKQHLRAFLDAHARFVADFVPEYMEANRHEPKVVILQYPKTIFHFWKTAVEELSRNPKWKEEMEEVSPTFFAKLPLLTVFHSLQKPTGPWPEIYNGTVFGSLKDDFSKLNVEDRESVYEKIGGADIKLSKEAQHFYELLGQFSLYLQRKDRALLFNAIMGVVVSELKVSLSILSHLKGIGLPQSYVEACVCVVEALLHGNSLPLDYQRVGRKSIFLELKKDYDRLSPEDRKKPEWENRLIEICNQLKQDQFSLFDPKVLVRAAFFLRIGLN